MTYVSIAYSIDESQSELRRSVVPLHPEDEGFGPREQASNPLTHTSIAERSRKRLQALRAIAALENTPGVSVMRAVEIAKAAL